MRILVTADLHFNHSRSRALAEQVIGTMNAAGGDVLLAVGDTAAADGDDLEQCLSLFRFAGPKLFVAGNHELWTHRPDSYSIFQEELPRRVRELGWHWLQSEPFVADNVAIVGSVGWYDYAFAPQTLGIPRRFYEAKVSPGAAERFPQYDPLFSTTQDVPAETRQIVARWNDAKFVKLHRSDDTFLQELLWQLELQLTTLLGCREVIAAVHHLPFRQLLPPSGGAQWDFAKAYLGSPQIGELLLRFPHVSHLFCGHSHMAAEAEVGPIHAINIGSGYGYKTFRVIDL